MEVLQTLSVALGLATLSGYSLYLTVFATGLSIHLGWIHLAPQYASLSVLGDPIILVVSGILFALEFFADKIPWVDSVWDAIHTVIRPLGGATPREPRKTGKIAVASLKNCVPRQPLRDAFPGLRLPLCCSRAIVPLRRSHRLVRAKGAAISLS
jgi:hypothetical protein